MEEFENIAYANIMILMCSEIWVTRKNKTNQLNKQIKTHPIPPTPEKASQ